MCSAIRLPTARAKGITKHNDGLYLVINLDCSFRSAVCRQVLFVHSYRQLS